MKEFADNNFNVNEIAEKFYKRVEKTGVKGGVAVRRITEIPRKH